MAGNRARATRVVDHIVHYLAEVEQARYVFGVHGANIEDLYDAILRADGPLQGVITKHEFSAGTMADGYFRAGNQLGVVAATSGGGALNLVPALGEAYASEIPLLALIGQSAMGAEGRGAFQDQSGVNGALPGRALFSSVSRFCERVEKSSDIVELLPAAIAAASAGPRGPAVLLLPKDVQQSVLDTDIHAVLEPAPTIPRIDNRVIDLLALGGRGARVVMVAGPGVAIADARTELAALADMLDAAVVVEPDGKDAFDNHSPRFAGIIGTMGNPSALVEFERAELCVVVGTRLPQVSSYGLADIISRIPLVCFATRPPYIEPDRTRETLLAEGELRATLHAALQRLSAAAPVRETVEVSYLPEERAEGNMLTSRDVVAVLDSVLPARSNVVFDAGNACSAAIHHLRPPAGVKQLLALGMGGMGFSFGAGLGAAFATGDRSYVIAGDGAFFMHGLEVHTAVEYQLPVTFVVFNNNAHAMCVSREKTFFPEVRTYPKSSPFNTFRPADIGAGIAAMFPGLRTMNVTTPADLSALREFLLNTNRDNAPAFVSVDIAIDEIPPNLPLMKTA